MLLFFSRDLVRLDKLKVRVVPNGEIETLFRTSRNHLYRAVYHKIVQTRQEVEEPSVSPGGLMQSLFDSRFSDTAVIVESSWARHYAKYFKHVFRTIFIVHDENLAAPHTGFAFQKDSPVAEEFNHRFLEMQGAGVLDELERKWFCPCFVGEHTFNPREYMASIAKRGYHVQLFDLAGAILILVCGLVLGGIVTAVECCVFKWAEKVIIVLTLLMPKESFCGYMRAVRIEC